MCTADERLQYGQPGERSSFRLGRAPRECVTEIRDRLEHGIGLRHAPVGSLEETELAFSPAIILVFGLPDVVRCHVVRVRLGASTAAKHGLSALDVLHQLMLGIPWLPPAQPTSP
jgi:hypothetical protein